MVKRLKFSSFFITVNTQAYFTSDESNFKEEADRLKDTFDNLINQSTMDNFITIKAPQDNNKDLKEIIRDINVYKVLELGTKQNRLHLHAMIIINHYSNLQLNLKHIRDSFDSEYNKNIHINLDLVKNKDDVQVILEYMSKGDAAAGLSIVKGK